MSAPIAFEGEHADFKVALAEMAEALEYAAHAVAIGERVIALDNAKNKLDSSVRSDHHGAAKAARDAAGRSIAEIAKRFEKARS